MEKIFFKILIKDFLPAYQTVSHIFAVQLKKVFFIQSNTDGAMGTASYQSRVLKSGE